MLVGKVPSPALISTRLGLPRFPSSRSRSPSPSMSADAIEYVVDRLPGSTVLVGKLPTPPPPVVSSNRLGLFSFPSSRSMSPSPSRSAAAIEFVSKLSSVSSMLVGKVPSPALISTRLGMPSP